MQTKLKALLLATAALGSFTGGALAQAPPAARTAPPVAAPLTPGQPAFGLTTRFKRAGRSALRVIAHHII